MVDVKKIEQLRLQHGYTQEQFAKMLGYQAKSAYNSKIKNVRKFSIDDIVKICNLFQLEPNDLILM